MPNYARKNNANYANFDTSYVWNEGSFKVVYKGSYTQGERAGQPCVGKMLRDTDQDPYAASIFDQELEIVRKSQDILDKFNAGGFVDRKVYLNEPEVWTFTAEATRGMADKKILVEPMIDNFEKFNSNSGWVAPGQVPWSEVMQALSHFSYHTTGGGFVLCDLQGGAYRDGMVLTDPVVMSRDHRYGPTDLGPQGITQFFEQHTCNHFCERFWTRPKPQRWKLDIQPTKGTSMMNSSGQMMVPTRHSRAPLSHGLAFQRIAGALQHS